MFCYVLLDEKCDDCVHVDLTLNPERYTGYSGEPSRRIWRSIYEENCFRWDNSQFLREQSVCAVIRYLYRNLLSHEKLAG